MKTIKHLTLFASIATLFTSCYTEVIVEDDVIDVPRITLNEVLTNYELWYVDIERSSGSTIVPFVQKALPYHLKMETFLPTTIFQV